MKKLVALLLSAAMLSLCLAGCGSSNESAHKEDVAQNDPAPLSVKAVVSTKVEACDDYLYGNAYVGMKEYVDQLLANAPENEFTVAVAEEYDKIAASGISGIEEDLLDVFALLPKVYHLDSGIEVGKAWCAGYDGLEAESENRLIVMELSGTPKKDKDSNPYWVFKTFRWPEASQNAGKYGFIIVCNVDAEYLRNVHGIDVSNDSGECSFSDGYGTTITASYCAVKDGTCRELYEKCDGLLNLLSQYYDDVYTPRIQGEKAETEAKEAAKNAEPAIGMTKSEVLNGAWGEPDERNVDEYAWGTSEQWVYDDHGYVYFENGIVNAIQHR